MNEQKTIIDYVHKSSFRYLPLLAGCALFIPLLICIIAMILNYDQTTFYVGLVWMMFILLCFYKSMVYFTKYCLTNHGVQYISKIKRYSRYFTWADIEVVYEITVYYQNRATKFEFQYLACIQKGADWKYMLSYIHDEKIVNLLKEKDLILIPKTEENERFIAQFKSIRHIGT